MLAFNLKYKNEQRLTKNIWFGELEISKNHIYYKQMRK